MRVCSHSSCPDKRNGCNLSASLNSDLFTNEIFEWSNLLTCTTSTELLLHHLYPVTTILLGYMKFCLLHSRNSDKSCCCVWFVCHDRAINRQCTARSGLPLDDDSSYYYLKDHNCLEGLIDSATDKYHVQNEGCNYE